MAAMTGVHWEYWWADSKVVRTVAGWVVRRAEQLDHCSAVKKDYNLALKMVGWWAAMRVALMVELMERHLVAQSALTTAIHSVVHSAEMKVEQTVA